MFIVAITLALLAAMGVYGLAATANDVSAAGHIRQATQARSASEASAMAAAESFTPGTSAELVATMLDPSRRSANCKSAVQSTSPDLVTSAACLKLSQQEMANIAASVNPFVNAPSPTCASPSTCPFFNTDSYGKLPYTPFLRVEVTNPVDIPPPPGSGLDGQYVFTQVTMSVYVDLKTSLSAPAETTMLARGRMTVGPYHK